MRSLLLDQTTWDLCLDAAGNLAVADAPYSMAQDVACAVKLFAGELWYDTAAGVPYFDLVLGRFPPPQLVKALLVRAALTVPGVVTAVCTLASIKDRTLSGQVLVQDAAGAAATVSFVGGASGFTTSTGAA
jgi:hypothetical protein